ncbi:MAG TPA: tetratricopeptide repeat protein [Desulfuromonadales bacterium]|nr:tetratricopeptide repeat protein [Desulfuromonadales bacterium]
MNQSGDFTQGCQFFAAGNYSAAEILFRRCLQTTPDDADVLSALGSALAALGSLDEAAHYLNRACQLQPESAPFHYNRANLLRRFGDKPGAERAYLEALQCDPGLAEAYHGLGSLHLEEGKLGAADVCLKKAIYFKNHFVPALHDLGQLRQRQGAAKEAEEFYRLSIAGDAAFLPALNSLGMLLCKGRVEEARHCFEQAIKADQNYLYARCNLAVLDTWCGNFDAAIASLRQAVIDAPNDGDIHFNLALALLAVGRFNEGWGEYEWRFGKTNPVPMRYVEIPRWHGELLAGKSILIHAEQGYGDSLQFIRFASLLASQGATVLVEGQDQIITPLLATVPGVAATFSCGEELPFKPDYQVPMMSLPLELGVDGAYPPLVSYLRPPEERVRFWRDTLSRLPGLKVGIAWSGRPEQENDANRSISPEQLGPLCGLDGITWVSLQFGPHKPSPPPISLFDPTDRVVDFCDSAALVAGLDLVITVNSAIAHLAGGLGKPVWLLHHWNYDWRWMHDRSDLPWYPSVKIFRQTLPGVWSLVMADLIEKLIAQDVFRVSNMKSRPNFQDLAVLVYTTHKYRDRCNLIESSWGKNVDTIFMVTDQSDPRQNYIKVTNNDTYSSQLEKTLYAMLFAHNNLLHLNWFYFVCDDRYVFVENLLNKISELNRFDFSVYGQIGNTWPKDKNLFYPLGGAGILLSKITLIYIIKNIDLDMNKWMRYEYCDVAIGAICQKLGINLVNIEGMFSQPPEFYSISNPGHHINFHYIRTKEQFDALSSVDSYSNGISATKGRIF